MSTEPDFIRYVPIKRLKDYSKLSYYTPYNAKTKDNDETGQMSADEIRFVRKTIKRIYTQKRFKGNNLQNASVYINTIK